MLNVCGKIMKILNLKRLFLNFFISSYLFVTPAYGQENNPAQADNFDQKRWSTLLKLVDSEIHTIKSNKYSGADLKHRLFELYSEKIKLIKKKKTTHSFKKQSKKKLRNVMTSSKIQNLNLKQLKNLGYQLLNNTLSIKILI